MYDDVSCPEAQHSVKFIHICPEGIAYDGDYGKADGNCPYQHGRQII
tara:strand:+ start:99 stop:239 length:141 start_codon:yes stop_codon:yes gene_type:complete